jgi:hypothetical protein
VKGSYFNLRPFPDFSTIPANADIHDAATFHVVLQNPSS